MTDMSVDFKPSNEPAGDLSAEIDALIVELWLIEQGLTK